MGSKTQTTESKTTLSNLYRPYAKRAAKLSEQEYLDAIAASKELDISDPAVAAATRDEYLRTVGGYYTSGPELDARAGRAADIAQRGLGGASRRFGSGAYANAVLGTRANAADAIYARERGYQVGALSLAPTAYEVSTAPLRDLYRRKVGDPTRLATAYTGTVAGNPLSKESKSKQKTTQPFDWGGFFASFITAAGAGAAGGAGAGAGAAVAACWVAEELWGVDDPRTHAARRAVLEREDDFAEAYRADGRNWAAALRREPALREVLEPVWLDLARAGGWEG